jgi:beta-lactamase class A
MQMSSTRSRFAQIVQQHWRHTLLYGIGGLSVVLVVVQLLYPAGQMLPYARIDGVAVGGWQKTDVSWELDRRYQDTRIRIYFGNNKTPYRSPTTGDVGKIVKNHDRIERLEYPWWQRLIPTSIIWAQGLQKVSAPTYETNQLALGTYIKKELGYSCDVAPKDAGVLYEKGALRVVDGEPGGTCRSEDIEQSLKNARPELSADSSVRIAITEIPPTVTTAVAQQLVATIMQRIGTGVAIQAGTETVIIPPDEILGWMDFAIEDGTLTPRLSNERAAEFMTKNIAPKVAVAAGVTKVTTNDFIETSRRDGPNGQALHIENTLANILAYLKGERSEAAVVTDLTAPRVEYWRSYSPTDTGLSALLTNFAKDHTGTFGVSFVELSGQHLRATYNESRSFVTASTYKLFVAYGTLRRVDAGTWGWDDANIADGRNLATCFDDMIVKSDNACAQALLKKIGYQKLTDEVKEIGLDDTSFVSDITPHSTAADESLFLAQLELSQLPISSASRDRMLGAMKRNIYRQGVPAGTSGQVADKVGFLWGLLHDSAIVYSPSGTYVLVILTDGSSWRAIADLTREIEALRAS